MGINNLNKETLLTESSYAKYFKRLNGKYPKGVLTLNEAKQCEDIKIIYSRYYNIVFFTDDYTFGLRSLSTLSRQSTKLPYNAGIVHKTNNGVVKAEVSLIIRTHEEYLKQYFNTFRLIENIDDLIMVLSEES